MRCSYCGHQQQVPDLEVRRRALVEQQREARIAEERRAEAAREERREAVAAQERAADRKSASGHRLRTWVISTITMLIAPVIIAITVFDLPARLGYGASGSDRLAQLETQLTGNGCKVFAPIDSEYASSNVSQLVAVDHQCIRVLAAGGSGHSTLSLRLFASDGKELAAAGDTTDPQLTYCAENAETLRYEIKIGVASKGRLSHLVMACPAPPGPPGPPAAAPATDKKRPRSPR